MDMKLDKFHHHASIRLWFLIITSVLAAGCATTSVLYYNFSPDVPMSASVGDPMITWSIVSMRENRPANPKAVGSVDESLCYLGKLGSVIRLAYRVTVNGQPLPVYNIDLRYSIARDSVIAFRQTKIKVLSADNSAIFFIVTDSPSFRYKSGEQVPEHEAQ